MNWNSFKTMRNFPRQTEEDKIIEEINKMNETDKQEEKEQVMTNPNNGAKIVIKKCAYCGKEFAVPENMAKRKKYCSKSCVKAKDRETQREYYYNVLKGKRQDNIAKHNAEKAAQATPVAPTTTPVEQPKADFFKVATVSLEIMKIANDNTTDANKMARIMSIVEDIMKGEK